jgi:2',3'-cyclic-nucleotide 2'-phosphodiesterase (5'-nucleotidase family)
MATAIAVVEELKRERVHLIIGLTHLSMEQDRALALAVPDIDVIVGGHDHEMMADLVGKTLIAKADANATALGVIRLKATRTADGWVVEKSRERQEVNPRVVEPDALIAKALAPYAAEMMSVSRTIGATDVPLDIREHVVRDAESNFGNYIADLIRAEMRADVGIVNGGALRGDRVVPAGPLTLEDLETALVFQDRIVAIKVTGDQLWQALENGVSRAGQRDGRFPQVSGLNLVFDPDSDPGQRILRVHVANAPLQRNRLYSLATIAFLTRPDNMDGYSLPTDTLQTRGALSEFVLRNLAKGPIKPSLDGRILALRQPR